MKLSKAMAEYFAHLESRHLSSAHITSVSTRLGRFQQELGDLELATISGADVNRFFVNLEEAGLAVGSLAGFKSTFRAFWSWCVSAGMIAENPADVLLTNDRRYSYRPVHSRPAPAEDFQTVLNALPRFAAHRKYSPRDVRDAALVSLAIDSARRRGELWRLRRRDIERALIRPEQMVDGGFAYRASANGKTGQQPVVFFDDTADLLRRWLELMPSNASFLWCSLRTGERLRVDALDIAFVRICDFAGVPTFRFHAVRKRDVTDIIAQTGDWKVGQLLAGHTDERTTQIHYNDVAEERVIASAAAMSARRRRGDGDDLAEELFGRR